MRFSSETSFLCPTTTIGAVPAAGSRSGEPDAEGGGIGRAANVGVEEIRIREVSRYSEGEWIPPIDAMGGPPAHVLYHDLVRFAGLRLFCDGKSRPWAALQDGAHRRAFPVPSPELRGAIDRFRMRRNLRPVPEDDIAQFVRIVVARVFDPDVETPRLGSPVRERMPSGDSSPLSVPASPEASPPWDERATAPPPEVASTPRWAQLGREVETLIGDLGDGPAAPTPVASPEPIAPAAGRPLASAPRSEPELGDPPSGFSRSGGRAWGSVNDEGSPRYVRVITGLVRDGAWMGTTRELSELTGDDPITVFDSLIRYRTELASHDLLVANVRVEDGYRWLAVDRSRVHSSAGSAPPE